MLALLCAFSKMRRSQPQDFILRGMPKHFEEHSEANHRYKTSFLKLVDSGIRGTGGNHK
jgi:hypothetical protein